MEAVEAELLTRLSLAVQCAYDPTAVAPGGSAQERHDVQRQATTFCDSVQRSTDGWRVALALLRSPGCNQHAKFFALSTLQAALGGVADRAALPPEARAEVRHGALQWVAEAGDALGREEAFLRTKLAVVLALCLKADFPEHWPAGFAELTALCARGPATTDLYLRVLVAVDEEIVAFHVDRSAEELARNTAVKDAMRATGTVAELVGAVCGVASTCLGGGGGSGGSGGGGAPLGVLALETLARYVGWVEAAHVSGSDAVLALLFACVQDAALAEAALGVILEILNKGLPDDDDGGGSGGGGGRGRVALLERVQVFRVVAAAPDQGDEDVAEAAAELVNSAGLCLLAAWDQLEPNVRAQAQAGGAVLAPETARPAACVAGLLQQATALLLRYLGHWCADVSGAVVPLAMRVLDTAKRQADDDAASGWPLGEVVCVAGGEGARTVLAPFLAAAAAPQLLPVVFEQLHYSEGFDAADDDEEAEEEVHKRAVRKVLMRVTRVCPALSLRFTCAVLGEVLAAPVAPLPFARAEAALRLVYHFGEGLAPRSPDPCAEPGGAFAGLLTALHRSDVASHGHWAVVVLYFELCERYWKHLRSDPPLIGLVLEAMCSPRGLTSPHPTLRTRTCFLLKTLCKRLNGPVLEPFAPTVLAGIHGVCNETEKQHLAVPCLACVYFLSFGGLGLRVQCKFAALATHQSVSVLPPCRRHFPAMPALLFSGLLDGSPGDMVQLFELGSLLCSALPPGDQVAALELLLSPVLDGLHATLADPAAQVASHHGHTSHLPGLQRSPVPRLQRSRARRRGGSRVFL